MRYARQTLPDIEWEKVEEAHGQRLFELPVEGEVLDFGVIEDDIANTDPRAKLDDEAEEVREDVGNTVRADLVVTLDQAPDQNEAIPASTVAEDVVIIDGLSFLLFLLS